MKRATVGLVVALGAWVILLTAAILTRHTSNIMEEFGTRSVYSDKGANTAINWLTMQKESFTCLFLSADRGPYCGIDIQLGDGEIRGVNLADYSSVRIAVEYSGPAESFRLSFRNAFPPAAGIEPKQHEFWVPVREGAYLYEIPLDNLIIPQWWLAQNPRIDVRNTQPDRTNVIHLSFDVENPMPIGQHFFRFQEFSLVSPWLTPGNALWWAIGSLLYLALVGFIYHFQHLKARLEARDEEMDGLMHKLKQADDDSSHFKQLSMYDPLTGMLNRRAALDLLDEYARKKSLAHTAIIVMDIDHFKDVNDNYGHAIGDEVLTKLSVLVRANLRESDAAVRWGGEEFVIICPSTHAQGAVKLADNLRNKIKQLHFHIEGLSITASFGIVTIGLDESFTEAFHRADKALYKAKNSGRDRVLLSTDEP